MVSKFDITKNSQISMLLRNMDITVWSESLNEVALDVEPRDEEGLTCFIRRLRSS